MGIYDPVFMQDNLSIHTSKLAQAWFKENGWIVAKHPAYSPDLTPIEHVWAYMKRQLNKKYPYLLNMPGGPDIVKEALADALLEIWNAIPESLLESLCTSIPRRVAAVIKAQGWYTKYQMYVSSWLLLVSYWFLLFYISQKLFCILLTIPLFCILVQKSFRDYIAYLCVAKPKLCALNTKYAGAACLGV